MSDPDITHEWVSDFSTDTAHAIVGLVDCAAADGGTLGHAERMTAAQARSFIDDLQRRIAAGESHALLGRVRGRPAFLAVLTPDPMPNCRHRAELGKGVVHPEFRGRQLVPLAFLEIVRRAEQLGVEQLVLDVREGTRAHRLWQAFGFATFGVLRDYARVGGASHRGHFMVQTVASLRTRLEKRRHGSAPLLEVVHA